MYIPKGPRALKPNPALRHAHLPPIRCTCGSERPEPCQVPHDLWLVDGKRLER